MKKISLFSILFLISLVVALWSLNFFRNIPAETFAFEPAGISPDSSQSMQTTTTACYCTCNLTVNITDPPNNSNVTTKYVKVAAVTNQKAICKFVYFKENNISILWREMEVTDGTFHSQIIEGLEDKGVYNVTLNCTDVSGGTARASVRFSTQTLMPVEYASLYLPLGGSHIGEGFSQRGILTRSDLPSLLSDGKFGYGSEIRLYSPVLKMGGSIIKNDTHNGTFDKPSVYIDVGTNPINYAFKYTITFNRNINFSLMHGKILKIVGENYTVNESSTNQRIIFNKEDAVLTLINNQPAILNNRFLNGTRVRINEPWCDPAGNVCYFEISFAMQDPKKDYIAVEESYDDPFFRNIRLAFYEYHKDFGAYDYMGSTK